MKHPKRVNYAGIQCKAPGCTRQASSHFYCAAHWLRVTRHGDPLPRKPISHRATNAEMRARRSENSAGENSEPRRYLEGPAPGHHLINVSNPSSTKDHCDG